MKRILFSLIYLIDYEFFKAMLTGNNAKTQDDFIDSSSESACWMNLKGTYNNKTAEKRRIEFMQSLKLSHEQLKKNKNACGSLPFLLFSLHRFNSGVSNNSRLICASESSHFSVHVDTKGLNNSK